MSENNLKTTGSREIILVEVDKEYYEQNLNTFLDKCVKIKAVRVEGEDFEGDETHSKLLKSYYKARKELRDYEFIRRHNHKNTHRDF